MEEEEAVKLPGRKAKAALHQGNSRQRVRWNGGDPAQEVVKSATNQKADLIVLGTHGKKGMDALWAGSVAPLIVDRTHLPILLVPVRRD